ncbi:thioesterase family protein [Brevibacillus choshinensis]|nr:thioesterase family protein [Brevibacillus choshinensis]
MVQSIYEYKVKWGDTDAAGIVFYPNFYKWMDQATGDLFYSLRYPLSKLFAEQKIGLPLLETYCEFKSPAFFEDSIHIMTNIVDVRDKVIKLTHEFFRGETLLASGYEVRAWTSFGQGKAKADSIPDEVRAALEK